MRVPTLQRLGAVGLATGLVGWSFVTPQIPMPWRVPVQAGMAGLLVRLTRAQLGLRPPQLWAGLRLGLAAGTAGAVAVAAAASAPTTRRSMSGRQRQPSAAVWLGWQIPLGTVWAEEAGYRAALATVAERAFGGSAARLLQAAAFGLSHVADARATGEPPAMTVLATAAGGLSFGWLADRADSLAAPMLAHLALNETAAAAVLAIRRRSDRRTARRSG